MQLEDNSFSCSTLVEPHITALPDGITIDNSVITSSTEGEHAQILLTNSTGYTQQLEAGSGLVMTLK